MVERRIKEARFPTVKSLDSFDFTAIPSLNKTLVLELARCEYIARRENVIAVGNSGTGKTHISLGLGLAAQKGLSVGFTTAAALVHELIEARDEKRLLRLQRQLAAYKLLIIDELGYVPLSTTGAELLFEVFSQRYERGSTIVTSNLPFDEWTGVFGSERLTGALLDRLTHHVHILEMNGDSYRLKQSKQRQRPGVTRPAVSLPQGSLRGRSGARHARVAPSVIHFYSGPPMHLLSGVDSQRAQLVKCYRIIRSRRIYSVVADRIIRHPHALVLRRHQRVARGKDSVVGLEHIAELGDVVLRAKSSPSIGGK